MDNQKDFYCLRLTHPQEPLLCQIERVHLARCNAALAKKYFHEDGSWKRRRHKGSYTQKKLSSSKGVSQQERLDFTKSSDDDNQIVEFIDDAATRVYIANLIQADLEHSSISNREIQFEFPLPIVYSALIFRMDGYFLSYFEDILQSSVIYRSNFYQNFSRRVPHYRNVGIPDVKPRLILSILIHLKPPRYHFLDPLGSDLANILLHEKHDLDCALSWLSTLGGAFSSLGESSLSWAKNAGEISLKQLKLAMRLKDPLVTSRCMIYLALSLIQRGYLRPARYILENQYKFFLSLPPGMDNRLGAMCKGVWHKLKHEWNQKILRKKLRTLHDISGQVG